MKCLVTYSSSPSNGVISTGSPLDTLGGGVVVEGRRCCPPSDGGDFGIPVLQSPAAFPSIGMGGGSGPVGLLLCSILSDLEYSKQMDILKYFSYGVCYSNLSETNGRTNQQ